MSRAAAGIASISRSRSARGRRRWPAAARPSPVCGAAGLARGFQPGAKAAQIVVDRLAVGADRAPRTPRPGSAAGREPAMTPSMTALIIAPVRRAISSMSMRRCARRVVLDRLDQPRCRSGRRPSRSFRPSRRSARSRSDRQRALGRDEAGRDRPARLHQFARHHHVDVADAGIERQHRPPRAEVARAAPARSRCNRWSRRCAARRRGSRSTAPASRGSRRR